MLSASSNARQIAVKCTSNARQIAVKLKSNARQIRINLNTRYESIEDLIPQLLISIDHCRLGMGKRIPDPIRREAIKKWLEGKSRDEIARELQRSQGAVSGIIKEAAENDPQFYLLREIAVKIKDLGTDIESFAPLVRLRSVLRDKGVLTGSTGQENLELMQDRFEAVIVNLEVFLFREGLSIEEFFGLVTNMYNLADKIGVPLNKFPLAIEELKDNMDVLRNEINQAEMKKQYFLNDNKMTLELLQEYMADKPFLVTLRNLKEQLADAKGRIRELEEELLNERRSNDLGEQNMGSVFETELDKAKLSQVKLPREMPHSVNMIKDVLKHPDRYMGVISRMSDLYDRYHGIPDAN
jgi:DNA repair exonuclease SbcCD ATPase subunit